MSKIIVECSNSYCKQKNKVEFEKKEVAKCARCGCLLGRSQNQIIKPESTKLTKLEKKKCLVCGKTNKVDTSKRGIQCGNCHNSLEIVSSEREEPQVRRFSPKPVAAPRETREIEFYRVLNGICSITENPFKIIFGKEKSDKYYRLVKTNLISSSDKNWQKDEDVHLNLSKQDEQTFKREEFQWTYHCPDCGDIQSYIHCTGCSNFICGSTRYLDDDGTECGSCPICEKDFELVPPYSDPVGTTERVRNKVIGENMEEPQLPPISNPISDWDDVDRPEVKELPNPQKKELNSSNVIKALPPLKKK